MAKTATSRKHKRTTATKRSSNVRRSAVRFASKVQKRARRLTQRIKLGLAARFAHLDRGKLKKALIACGIAAAIATGIVVMAKITPLLVALLALLGLGAVLQMWDRLRSRMPV
jgi:Flp pilus assembly protein TadB